MGRIPFCDLELAGRVWGERYIFQTNSRPLDLGWLIWFLQGMLIVSSFNYIFHLITIYEITDRLNDPLPGSMFTTKENKA